MTELSTELIPLKSLAELFIGIPFDTIFTECRCLIYNIKFPPEFLFEVVPVSSCLFHLSFPFYHPCIFIPVSVSLSLSVCLPLPPLCLPSLLPLCPSTSLHVCTFKAVCTLAEGEGHFLLTSLSLDIFASATNHDRPLSAPPPFAIYPRPACKRVANRTLHAGVCANLSG